MVPQCSISLGQVSLEQVWIDRSPVKPALRQEQALIVLCGETVLSCVFSHNLCSLAEARNGIAALSMPRARCTTARPSRRSGARAPHACVCMQALCGLMRVRTCPELRVARVYGRVIDDPEHPQLYHIVACDPTDCTAFDLEIATRHGFMPQSSGRATHPTIQVRCAVPRRRRLQSGRPCPPPPTPPPSGMVSSHAFHCLELPGQDIDASAKI